MSKSVVLIGAILGCFLIGCGGSAVPSASPTVSTQATTEIPTLANTTSIPQTTDVATNAPVSTNVPDATTIVTATTVTTTTMEPTGQATTESAAPTQTGTSGNLSEPPSGSGLDVIRQATLNQLDAESFRATTKTETADGTTSTLVLEYVSPDRLHLALDGTTEQIAIKDVGAWSKTGGAWSVLGDAASANMVFGMIAPEQIETQLQQIDADSVEYVGTEDVNGRPAFVYEYTSTFDLGGQSVTSENKVWIDAEDQRTVRLEQTSNSLLVEDGKDTVQVEYEYDIPITIEAPM